MAPSKNVLDAAIQTDGTEPSDGSCQTDSPEGKDFQVQANIQRDSGSVEVKTTEEDIRCPKITSSIAEETRTKKRKLCQVSTSSQATPSDTGDELINDQATVELSDGEILSPRNQNDGSNIDNSILNSEIYQIYCRAECSFEAAQKISGHNKCVLFE